MTKKRFGMIVGLLGLIILFWHDPITAAGVWILMWGNNMERGPTR